ncbi:hypothetical protein [Hyphomicrobium sp.]|uniref:hypothetical protein n=1 Tax=Hyphomicrobium sp. TaxID=82 RepID=UPI0025BE7399|nr:hypothetical protein [Hyphomicrobium sp.]MCC7252164.1 hypothetical protein [Hyphomicrobium sp.]
MHCRSIAALLLAAALAGCSSSGNGVSTASILGEAPTPPAAGAAAAPIAQTVAVVPPAPTSSPTDRAFQVGTVSARAAKCGYNFDTAKLKASYLAHEVGLGASNEQLAQIEKIYQVSYNGVMKAAADETNYCSERKTAGIKQDLGRLLAGDYEPPKKAVVAKKDDEGFFSGLFGDSGVEDSGPKFGSGDWWEKQAEKAGGN